MISHNEYFPLELPSALVFDMIEKSERVGQKLHSELSEILKIKNELRKRLSSDNLLNNEESFNTSFIPTTCGVDGSCFISRLLAADLVGCAAIAVEGLAPPSEKKHWQKPHHRTVIEPEKKDPAIPIIARAIMTGMELELAVNAPHDLVFLDGSFTSVLVNFNKVTIAWKTNNTNLSTLFIKNLKSSLQALKTILTGKNQDRIWISLSKQNITNEFSRMLGLNDRYNDKALMTILLSEGEFTRPIRLEKTNQPWQIKVPSIDSEAEKLKKEINLAVNQVRVFYYRPYDFKPALKVDIPEPVANDRHLFSLVLKGIKYQSEIPSIFEPYPLYLADRMVSKLSEALPTCKQITINRMLQLHRGDIREIYFTMHKYRTDIF